MSTKLLLGLLLVSGSMFAQSTIRCSSDDMRRHYCSVDTRGGVELIRQRSDAACIQGRTWGYDRRGIWVDRGCRADFAVNVNSRYGYGYGRDEGYYGGPFGNRMATLYCASDDMRRQYCSADTRDGVRLIRQRSDASCVLGRTWGYNSRGIWVDRGCRADFEIGAGGSSNGGRDRDYRNRDRYRDRRGDDWYRDRYGRDRF
jgi:hypothetical protein